MDRELRNFLIEKSNQVNNRKSVLVIEQLLDGLWDTTWNNPGNRKTDLPPKQVKTQKFGDAQNWENRLDFDAYQAAYSEFGKAVKEKFAELAEPREELEVIDNPLEIFYKDFNTIRATSTLDKAIEEVGLPTRADVDDWADRIASDNLEQD